MRKLLIITLLFTLVCTQAFSAITITITDGSETRGVNLNEDQSNTLITVMQKMKAHQYKLYEKIDPISVSGISELQQIRMVIIQILKGIAYQSNRREEMETAEANASSYDSGL